MPRALRRHASCYSQGFSLVEVSIALVVIGVVLVGLMGMLPSGTSNFHQAMDTTITAQIAQRILHDAEEAEFDALIDRANLPVDPLGIGSCPLNYTFRSPSIRQPVWRYFDAAGTEVRPKDVLSLSEAERRAIVYYANTRIMPRAAISTAAESSVPVAQVTVQVARNPMHQTLPLVTGAPDDPNVPERNLLKTGRVPIFTYAGLIGKNQGR